MGSGGMGVVYRARDSYSGSLVALKLLQGGGQKPEEAERFAREAQLLSELRHPNIVAYVAHGQSPDGQRFLAMEWLDGEDLGQRLLRGPLPLHDCLVLLLRIADALVASHQQGIIHRDLKPSNLFLSGGAVDSVKLLDFGIARRLEMSGGMTRTGFVVGTPEYMSPEQARGVKDITPAADIFSAGCILYHCLTGRAPFVGEHLAAVLLQVLFESPPPVEERRSGVPPEVVELLRHMLVKDPGLRLADGAALRLALQAVEGLAGSTSAQAETALSVPRSRPRSPFSDSEQGLVSVVTATPPPASEPNSLPERLDAADQQRLLVALQSFGVRAEFVAGDALIVCVSRTGSATDQVTLAAQAAFLIKKQWPRAVVSLATGRGALQDGRAVGDVIDQGDRLRSEQGQASAPTSEVSGIWLDQLSAQLLQGRFTQVQQSEGGAVLLLSEELQPDADRKIFGKPTPCVGREAELGLLESQFTTCAQESEARVILITAPPGAGKSRLLREFLRRLAQRENDGPLSIFQVRGELTAAGAPYALIGQLLRTCCGILAGAPPEEKRAQLAARIGRYLPDVNRRRVVEFLGEICGVSFPAEGAGLLAEARKNPRVMHEQVRDAFVTWLEAECGQACVLVILDDLQWGDALSISLLDHALRLRRSSPLFVLALARPEVREHFPKLWPGHHVQDIPLKPLGRKACERLVLHVLGNTWPPAQIAQIVQQSAGNAFFLEELIRSAREGGSEVLISKTIIAMLQARIGRMEPGLRQTVRAASIFGQSFWRSGVAELLGLPPDDPQLAQWLDALVDAEVIEPHTGSRLLGQKEFGFRHGLVCDAAYALLADGDIVTGHRLAARFLEAAGESEPLVLAEHCRRGQEPEPAIAHYLRASEDAARLGSLPRARQHCEQAQALVHTLPESPVRDRLRIDILLRLVRLTLRIESPKQNLARLDEATALLSPLRAAADPQPADESRYAWSEFLSGRLYFHQGNVAEALGCYQRVLPVAEASGDATIVAMASMSTGVALMLQGHLGTCRPYLNRAIALGDQLDSEGERLRVLGYLAISQVGSGHYREGMALHEQVLARAAKRAEPALLASAHVFLAISLALCGDFPALLNQAQLALSHAEKSEEKIYRHTCLSLLGWAHGMLGNFQVVQTYRAEAKSVESELGGQLILSDWFLAADAEIALHAGDIPPAIALLAATVPKWKHEGRLLALARAEHVWGLSLGIQSAVASAEADAHFQLALEIMEFTQQVLPAARLRLEWAQVCERRGNREQAHALRTQAVTQLAESGCPHIIPCIEGAIAALYRRQVASAGPGGLATSPQLVAGPL